MDKIAENDNSVRGFHNKTSLTRITQEILMNKHLWPVGTRRSLTSKMAGTGLSRREQRNNEEDSAGLFDGDALPVMDSYRYSV